MHYRSQLGREAEHKTAQYLLQNGFAIIEQNYRKKRGEIDIIASTHDLLVFVEVKMRQNNYFDLSDVITPSKRRKIISVAKEYIGRNGWQERSYRFDVALLHGTENNLELSYIPNAFNEGDFTW
jgi:putative endonuclease